MLPGGKNTNKKMFLRDEKLNPYPVVIIIILE